MEKQKPKTKKKRNPAKIISAPMLSAVVLAMGYVVFSGLPTGGVPRYGTYDRVDITRYVNGRAQQVIITQATDDYDIRHDNPFLRFKLAPNMINFIKTTPWAGAREGQAEYIYTFYMNDGSQKSFYISRTGISKSSDDSLKKQHKNSEYETFKNITDFIYFGDPGDVQIPDNLT